MEGWYGERGAKSNSCYLYHDAPCGKNSKLKIMILSGRKDIIGPRISIQNIKAPIYYYNTIRVSLLNSNFAPLSLYTTHSPPHPPKLFSLSPCITCVATIDLLFSSPPSFLSSLPRGNRRVFPLFSSRTAERVGIASPQWLQGRKKLPPI